MPISYSHSVDRSPEADQYTLHDEHTQRKQLKRDYLGNIIMGTRRSCTPDDGSTSLEVENGRPLSRGQIIERLKRSKNQTATSEHLEHVESAMPLRPQTHSFKLEDTAEERRPQSSDDSYNAGMNIERPRSALHSGDFRERPHTEAYEDLTSSQLFAASLKQQHHQHQHQRHVSSSSDGDESAHSPDHSPPAASARSFPNLFLPPTSPLMHASRSTDADDLDFSASTSISSRRPTFSPPSLPAMRSDSTSLASLGRFSHHNHAYRAHQPHRPIAIPQPPRARQRGISNSSDASPMQHAPMVGSYEESILRGRMSAIPSRPLDFIAQIGVLGRGKCKPSLRCPAHVSVPFPAVFYSHNGTSKTADSAPSPYVGLIDIEHSFPEYEGKSPAGGCYRIPQQGQLQIIIKNPNKTAVKLFLVPYDLSDMEPGTKTFIRQRSYSAGPIIDMPMSSRSNLGTDRPEAALSHSDDPTDRPTLRYLVHMHICCTARGRYFLYRSIRVVFANRVPDGKERLRNEVQLPEPRYTPYRPGSLTSSAAASPAIMRPFAPFDPSVRRLSAPFSFAAYGMDQADGLSPAGRPSGLSHGSTPSFSATAVVQRRIASDGAGPSATMPKHRFSAAFNLTATLPNEESRQTTGNSSILLDKPPAGLPLPTAQSTTPPPAPVSANSESKTEAEEPVVLLESFDTWLNRRRRNGEMGQW